MYMNMNAEKIVKIVLLVIMFCTLVGCSFCKVKESFSETTEKLKEGDYCTTKLGTEGCVGINCVKFEGKQYEPDHGSCKTNYCACEDTESGDSLCSCTDLVSLISDETKIVSNDADSSDEITFSTAKDGTKQLELDLMQTYKLNPNKANTFNGAGIPGEEYKYKEIEILNIDNIYDIKIKFDSEEKSFKLMGDKFTYLCSDKENEKLVQIYDGENLKGSFCFYEPDYSDGGRKRLRYDYEDNEESTCHESCKSCGFGDDPSGENDCISCESGKKLIPVYSDGTGRCVDQVEPTDKLIDEPTDELIDEPTDGPTDGPTDEPTDGPTDVPTDGPTDGPTTEPTTEPTDGPTTIPMNEKTFSDCMEQAKTELRSMNCGKEFELIVNNGPDKYCEKKGFDKRDKSIKISFRNRNNKYY